MNRTDTSLPRLIAALAILATAAAAGAAPSPEDARLRALDGVYEVVTDAGAAARYRNRGAPARVIVAAHNTAAVSSVMQSLDPDKLCQAVGPFRMMAREPLRFELVAADDRLVMLFEDVAHGYLRSLYTHRPHPNPVAAHYAFQGDSVAHWVGDALVVDTVGFNDRTWLNDHVRASEALHLTERLRPLEGGKLIEYRMRASDPKTLAADYSYTRYFRRVDSPIRQDVCEPDSNWSPEQGF